MTRGRPRDPGADARILAAAAAEIRQRGYDGLSVERVAEQAGVAKTTLYRRWPTKAQLVIALITRMRSDVPFEPTGDARRDLTGLVTSIAASLAGTSAALIADLAAAAARDPAVGESVHALWAERHGVVTEVVAQAQAAGVIHSRVPAAVLVDQLVGPLYYRLLITGEPVTESYARTLTERTFN
ncbi:TetR/AcrR family transcriptional regulator [Kribbella sp. NBC_01245]|uniref:TetR/AcrR family transcriptional regulator n=1 Tax=Kribbella sp. NBC_01245 TaxID=2903578 RepID=UPI002E29F97D|nr:TetR/AcrR family transcriptional regulator [Kribbella sp. NBC_01245]